MGMYAGEVHRAFTLIEPGLDLGWLGELADELAGAPAVRKTTARIVRAHQLQRKGRGLMRGAHRGPLTPDTSLQYRDARILSVTHSRPCRVLTFRATNRRGGK